MPPTPTPTVAAARLEIRFDESVPVFRIPQYTSFEDLREWLRTQIPEHRDRVGGRTGRLDLGEREIKLFDLRRLIHFLREDYGIDITGLYAGEEAVTRFAERELKLKLFPLPRPTAQPVTEANEDPLDQETPTDEVASTGPGPDEVPTETGLPTSPLDAGPPLDDPATETCPEPLETESLPATPGPAPARGELGQDKRTLTVRRTLRSGAVVRYDGDVFVFGDVNPGAHVVASGNIVIMGSLKGMAHAGALGDESCFILSLDLRPTQLRVGRKIAIAPGRPAPGDILQPELASVLDGQIVLEPYQGRLRSSPGRA